MKFYNRAFLSIFRQQSKSIILLLVSFVLGSGIIISFLIKSAINESTEVMLNRSNSAVTISLGTDIDEKTINEIGSSSYIKNYDYNISSNITSDDLEHYEGDVSKYLKADDKITNYFDSNFSLTGINDNELLLIKQKKAKLVAGRVFEKGEITANTNSTIVTEKFAQKNGIDVGSSFKIKANTQEDGTLKQRTYTLKIIGIIDLNDKNVSMVANQDSEEDVKLTQAIDQASSQNIIIVPNSLTKQINEFIVDKGGNNKLGNIYNTPVYILNSPKNLKSFIDEESSKLPKQSSFVSDYDNIQKAISSTTALNNIASVAFVTMTFLTVAILSLVVVLFLVNRRQEFGIYQALGEKKYKTIGQVVIEMCVVGLVGFVLAISSSGFIADKVSDSIMRNTNIVESTQETNTNISDVVPYLDDSSINSNYIMNNYSIRVSIKNVIFILIIGTTTMLISSIGPSVYILRLKPKEILM